MNITSAQYITTPDENGVEQNACINIVVDGKTISAPINAENRHYQAIQEWASQEGNTIQDAD